MSIGPFHSEFPLQPHLCYLNHAAVSPWPKSTMLAVNKFAKQNCTVGATHYPEWLRIERTLRQRAARLFGGVSIQEIALFKSTSEALSVIAYGLTWQPGDEVIITDQEFPSNRIVWESLRQFGVKVVLAKLPKAGSTFDKSDVTNAIKKSTSVNTRLISVSSVQYASGLKLDLVAISQLCQQRKILFCVDAIQSLGAIAFDQKLIKTDFIVADGHKWMMGAEGLAIGYIKKDHINLLQLHQFGWHMVKNRGQYDRQKWEPETNATRFECGSPNMLGIHALNASLTLIEKIGINTIEEHLHGIVDSLIEKLLLINSITLLSPVDKDIRAGIVTFKVQGIDHEKLYRSLMGRGVICAHRGGGIRFSPHFYTPESIIEKAVCILKEEISLASKVL